MNFHRMRSRHVYHETGLDERLWFTWLWAGGLSFRAIAKRAGRSPTTVRRWVKYLLKEEHNARKEKRWLIDQHPFPMSHYVNLSNYLQKQLLYWLYVDNTFRMCDPLMSYQNNSGYSNGCIPSTLCSTSLFLERNIKSSSDLR